MIDIAFNVFYFFPSVHILVLSCKQLCSDFIMKSAPQKQLHFFLTVICVCIGTKGLTFSTIEWYSFFLFIFSIIS